MISADYNPRQDLKFAEEVIKHANTTSKLAEVALVCALDMCRAATHVHLEGDVPLRLIAFDIAHEIRASDTFVSLMHRSLFDV